MQPCGQGIFENDAYFYGHKNARTNDELCGTQEKMTVLNNKAY